jgi:SRSO17 transposase
MEMDSGRTYRGIEQTIEGADRDGQNTQHFMSDSPWSSQAVFEQVHQDIKSRPWLEGGSLHFDESADECSGGHKAGAARQYLGRFGKVDTGQVGVLSTYSKDGYWLLVGAELYLPENWFKDPNLVKEWKRLHIPAEREFQTKVEIARGLFDQAINAALPFEWTTADSFYGRSFEFRRHVDGQGKKYLMCVPQDEFVWLGHPWENSAGTGCPVRDLVAKAVFEPIKVRDCERGDLIYEHAFVPVWSVNSQAPVEQRMACQELLLIRKEPDGTHSYALSNATLESASKQSLAEQRAEHYFVERTIQDSKSELGWDELQALKYRAYMHSLAICAIALIYMADVKHQQRQHFTPQDQLMAEVGVNRLPDLSLANVKELIRSVMPLPSLTKEQATEKVITTLFLRTKDTASKIRKAKKAISQKT